jgi:hypothetical protein
MKSCGPAGNFWPREVWYYSSITMREPGRTASWVSAVRLSTSNTLILYDKKTVVRILAKNGFEILRVFTVRNAYPLAYWCKMAPMPAWLKSKLLPALRRSPCKGWIVPMRAGNLGILARVRG